MAIVDGPHFHWKICVLRSVDVIRFAASLYGTRSIDVPSTAVLLSESLIKQMTGGDPISARFLYAEFFDFVPVFKLLIAGNHQPVIRGDDTGIWRRLHLVPFTVTIPAGKRDQKLPDKLRKELPGILNFALQGCLDWQKKRLCPPRQITEAVAEYRSEMDILGQWVTENCVVDKGLQIKASSAYANYRLWAKQNGFRELSSSSFGRRMKERYKRVETREGRFYQGLSKKDNDLFDLAERVEGVEG